MKVLPYRQKSEPVGYAGKSGGRGRGGKPLRSSPSGSMSVVGLFVTYE